jgi:hypothetical protein
MIDAATGRSIPNAPLDIYANGAYVATTKTDWFGRFSQRITLPRAGSYTFVARFRGGEF